MSETNSDYCTVDLAYGSETSNALYISGNDGASAKEIFLSLNTEAILKQLKLNGVTVKKVTIGDEEVCFDFIYSSSGFALSDDIKSFVKSYDYHRPKLLKEIKYKENYSSKFVFNNWYIVSG